MQLGHTTVKWDTLNIILLIATCFAIGAVGFFLAVFFGRSGQANTAASQELTVQKKDQVMQSLVASEQTPNGTSSSGVSTGGSVSPVSGVAPSQADVNDKSAAEKLNILNNLNSQ